MLIRGTMELLKSYDSVNELKKFLDENGFAMRKRFGQNFLVSPGGRKKILDILDVREDSFVWEVGPGLGALTHELVKTAGNLTVFEIDRGFIRYLDKAFGDYPGFSIVEGDAVKSWKKEGLDKKVPDRIVGNLPYNAASAIIASYIEHNFIPEKMVFTVQKEMGERVGARPGSKNYSSFSMLCQFRCSVKDCGDLKPGAFYPQPEVTSRIIELVPHGRYPEADQKLFFTFISELFTSRRKKIRNNLLKGRLSGSYSRETIFSAMAHAGIDPEDRGENIDVERAVKAVLFLQKAENVCC